MTLGDVLSIVGLVIAIYQIYRTKRIAYATQRSVQKTARRVGLYSILLAVPELSRLEADLERAVVEDDVGAARRILKEWREVAADFKGVIERGDSTVDETLRAKIASSISLAATAKSQLIGSGGVDLMTRTTKVRSEIEAVCADSRAFAARIRSSDETLGEPVDSPTENWVVTQMKSHLTRKAK